MTDEQDFTDPDFVLGAVLAQIEDLQSAKQIEVLKKAIEEVNEQRARRVGQVTGYGIRYIDQAPVLLPYGVKVDVQWGDHSAKVEFRCDLRAEAEIHYRKLEASVTGPIALYAIIGAEDTWFMLEGVGIVSDLEGE